MRLDRFVALATGMTRSQARRRIAGGGVSLDQATRPLKAKSPVSPQDRVYLEGELLSLDQQERYFMLNKPAGVISATRDEALPTVVDFLPLQDRRNVHPAGRLDRDTTGLLLLTSDGRWSHRLTSPRSGCRKVYRVTVADPLDDQTLRALAEGVWLRGEKRATLPAGVEATGSHEFLLTLSEGRYHQVKRMVGAQGNRVMALHREQIGDIRLDESLQPGEYRSLTQAEIDSVWL